MKLKLTFLDLVTQQPKEIMVNTPVAIGCDIGAMPTEVDQQDITHVLVFDASINTYHALVRERKEKIVVTDTSLNRPIGVSKNRFTVGGVKFTFEVLEPELETSNHHSQTISNSSNQCEKMVGFLFKRPCDRTSSVDCPHCNNVEDELNDYASDYVYYENFGNYDAWGHTYYRDRHYYHYDSNHRSVEFTEADNVAFESEGDRDFEQDYSAS